MTDPKLIITESDWDGMTPELQAKTMYRTTMGLREDVITLSKKVDNVLNKPEKPCTQMESRIEKLEKWSKVKTIATIIAGFLGGTGGSQIPK